MLERCSFVRLGTNRIPLTPAIRAEILAIVKRYGSGELMATYLICFLSVFSPSTDDFVLFADAGGNVYMCRPCYLGVGTY